MRVSGEDELVDSDVPVFEETIRHLLVAADEGRPGAFADQADPGPEVGGDHEVVPVAALGEFERNSNRRTKKRCPPSRGGHRLRLTFRTR
jgi:hypothetical protein